MHYIVARKEHIMKYTSFSKWLEVAYRSKGTFVLFLCMEFYMYGILNTDNVLVESAANPK